MYILIAVVVITIVVGLVLTKFSSKQDTKEDEFGSSPNISFKSPVKSDTTTKNGTPINEKTGTVMTPAGRRSARLARRKED